MTRTHGAGALLPTSFADVPGPCLASWRGLLAAFAAWRLRRRQRAQLYALSDGTLKDIGLSRWEIDSIVSSPNRDASGRVR
jgi:uncharacterized protein YjiS (DUF1127 family)